ncbi:MAG: DUF427 domain-containing protein [Actinomycetota bacterium]
MAGPGDITLVEGAVHNPNEPRHFMRIVPAGRRYTATADGQTLADSEAAVVVKEVGRDIYDPVVYFPRADVNMDALVGIDKSTHCPVKGNTEYFDVASGDVQVDEAAWSYVGPVVTGAEELEGRIAFDVAKFNVG